MKRIATVAAVLGLLVWAGAGRGDEPKVEGKTVKQWVEQLKDSEPRRAAKAMTALTKIGEPAVDPLIEVLKDKDEEARPLAAQVLGDIGPAAKKAIPALIEALKDDDADPSVRNSAASALAEMGPAAKPAVPALLAALKDDDAGVRGSAAFTLGKVGAEAKTVLGPLLEALDDEEASVRSNILLTVAGLGRDAREATPTLVKSL
jgi:HEAT repeat protein